MVILYIFPLICENHCCLYQISNFFSATVRRILQILWWLNQGFAILFPQFTNFMVFYFLILWMFSCNQSAKLMCILFYTANWWILWPHIDCWILSFSCYTLTNFMNFYMSHWQMWHFSIKEWWICRFFFSRIRLTADAYRFLFLQSKHKLLDFFFHIENLQLNFSIFFNSTVW